MSNKVYVTENFWYDKVCPEKDAGVEKEKGKKMRYGKIRIEDGFFVFTRHMMLNSLPWILSGRICAGKVRIKPERNS